MTKPRIVLQAIDDNSPGYLWRLRRSLDLQSQLEAKDVTPQKMGVLFEKMVDELILPYVLEPEDKNEAKELMLGPQGLSKNEYYEILGISKVEENGDSPLLKTKPKRRKPKT